MQQERIEIVVSADDIASGKKSDCSACPLALALARAIGVHDTVKYVSAGFDYLIAMGSKFRWQTDAVPQEAIDFIWDFDHDDNPAPFTISVLFTKTA